MFPKAPEIPPLHWFKVSDTVLFHPPSSFTAQLMEPRWLLGDAHKCVPAAAVAVYVAGQRYPPLVGQENMYMHRGEWSMRKACDGGISEEQRATNDWGLLEINKGRDMWSGKLDLEKHWSFTKE